MRRNRFQSQLPEDFFEGPPAAPTEPTEPEPDPQAPTPPGLPEDFFQGPEDARPVDSQPVVRAPTSPTDWVKGTIGNLLPSAWENIKDTAALFRPWGERASGETTAIPGVADLVRLFAEGAHQKSDWSKPVSAAVSWPISKLARGYTELDEALLGGMEQSGNETPMFDAFAQYLTGRYDFAKPEVRAAFAQVVHDDPFGVLTDILTVASLGSVGAVSGARAASGAVKGARIAIKAASPRSPAYVGRVARAMDKAVGITERVASVVNQGFHIPGVPGERLMKIVPERRTPRGFQVKTGVADILDPGVWAVRGAGKGIQAATRGMSRYKPKTATDKTAQQVQQERLVRQGFTDNPPPSQDAQIQAVLDEAGWEMHGTQSFSSSNPDRYEFSRLQEMLNEATSPQPITKEQVAGINTPLSLISESEHLQAREALLLDKESLPLVEAMERAEAQLDRRIQEVMAAAHEDGDIGVAAAVFREEYDTYRQNIMRFVDRLYKRAGLDPGMVVDMRTVYTALQELRVASEAVSRLGDSPDAPTAFGNDAPLRTLDEHVQRAASQNQNMLSPEFLAGEGDATPTRPVAPTSGDSPARTEDALYGTNTRLTRDLSTGQEFATTYRLMELDDIITSHDVQGAPTAEYNQALQVKDMSESASLSKVTEIANQLFPEQMLAGRTTQSGTPILNRERMVVSGNHRVNALRVAYETVGTYQAYRDELKGAVGQYGYTPEQVDNMNVPVLVRVLTDDIDEVAFTRGANVGDVAQLSQTSQSVQDMHLLDKLADEQTSDTQTVLDVLNTQSGEDLPSVLARSENENFRNLFINNLSASEQTQFVGQGTQLHPRGVRRIVDAVRAKVFSGTYGASMRELFTQARDSGFRNMQKGIDDALPALVDLRSREAGVGTEYDISEPLAEAVMKIRYLIENTDGRVGVERAINTYLGDASQGGQATLGLDVGGSQAILMRELDETGQAILRLLATGIRRPSVIRNFLRTYSAEVGRMMQPTMIDMGPVKPRAELVQELVDELLASQDPDAAPELRRGLEEFFGEDATVEEAPSQPSIAREPVEPTRPILFENVIAYRDQLAESLQSPRLGPQVREWRSTMLNALDKAILETYQTAFPERAGQAGFAIGASRRMQTLLNSEFAQLMAGLVDGSRNPEDPVVQRALRNVFTSDDTPITVMEKFKLMGGEHTEAGQRVKRIFLGKLFDFVHTETGKADASAVTRGEESVADVGERYNPKGMQTFMNQFKLHSTDYSDETLRAILGSRIVDDLHDLDRILQHFGEFMQRSKRNTSFFEGEGRAQRYAMERVTEGIGWALISGAAGGAGGFRFGGMAASVGGAVGAFLLQWLGNRAVSAAYPVLFRTERGRSALINGIELAMKESWNMGARILLRSSRLASKKEEE